MSAQNRWRQQVLSSEDICVGGACVTKPVFMCVSPACVCLSPKPVWVENAGPQPPLSRGNAAAHPWNFMDLSVQHGVQVTQYPILGHPGPVCAPRREDDLTLPFSHICVFTVLV